MQRIGDCFIGVHCKKLGMTDSVGDGLVENQKSYDQLGNVGLLDQLC